ncbi:polysaccharide deacetylase family protein [Camelliibacillus cellulosilyticus]|uniref:Polysaccharide deacetylase family protein n=1 Tax=Camelliibacillus cellulosilyticus TaxID=2174486 RepID=A0ABV9GKD3_9BACL
MKKKRQLNRKGKFAALIFSTLALFLLVGIIAVGKEKTSSSQKKAAIPFIHAEPLLSVLGTKKAFASSNLNHSIEQKKQQEKEEAQKKKEEEQRKEEQAIEQAHEKQATEQNKKDQKEKAIYLTFDDGPSPVANELLNILDQYKVKATFFMLGPRIQSEPSVVKRMVKEGFGVGLHGITHNAHEIYSSTQAPLDEMTADQEILQTVTGVHSELSRLPYGSIPYLTEDMRLLLHQHDFKIWDWNVDSKDWDFKNVRYVQKTINDIENIEKAGETPVVLMHDKPETIHYLPKLLNYLNQNGYKTKILTNNTPPLTFKCEGRCHSISR